MALCTLPIEQVPIEKWAEVFDTPIDNNLAPNEAHVYVVFDDGEVVSTKGSWAFLKRSMFVISDRYPFARWNKSCAPFDNPDRQCNGYRFIATYDHDIALCMGKRLYDLLSKGVTRSDTQKE